MTMHWLLCYWTPNTWKKELNRGRTHLGSHLQRVPSTVVWSHVRVQNIMVVDACGGRKCPQHGLKEAERKTGSSLSNLPPRTSPSRQPTSFSQTPLAKVSRHPK